MQFSPQMYDGVLGAFVLLRRLVLRAVILAQQSVYCELLLYMTWPALDRLVLCVLVCETCHYAFNWPHSGCSRQAPPTLNTSWILATLPR